MLKVLIVEDSATDLASLKAKVEGFGHEVLAATSGEEGVVLAANEQPDVILMDIVMSVPGLNGFQATRHLKRSPDTKHIPVIIVSSKSQDIDIIWGERQGADDYLIKPVKTSVLNAAIEQVVAERMGPQSSLLA